MPSQKGRNPSRRLRLSPGLWRMRRFTGYCARGSNRAASFAGLLLEVLPRAVERRRRPHRAGSESSVGASARAPSNTAVDLSARRGRGASAQLRARGRFRRYHLAHAGARRPPRDRHRDLPQGAGRGDRAQRARHHADILHKPQIRLVHGRARRRLAAWRRRSQGSRSTKLGRGASRSSRVRSRVITHDAMKKGGGCASWFVGEGSGAWPRRSGGR